MATRLFLHDAANALTGTFPSAEQSTALVPTCTAPTANTLRTMNSLTGTAQVVRSITSSATTAAQVGFCAMFCSGTLDTNQVIPPQPLLLNFANRESSASMNIGADMRINAYVWRPSTGAKVGTLVDGLAMTGDAEPGAALSIRTNIASVTSTVTLSANAGDVIVCEIWNLFTQSVGTGLQCGLYWDGTTVTTTNNAVVTNHASFFELQTSTLTFGTPPVLSISCSFGQTLGAATLAGVGAVAHTASAGLTLATVGLSTVGRVAVSSSAAVNLAALALSGTGTVADPATISSSFGQTLAALTLGGVGAVALVGSFNNTLAAASLTGSASIRVSGAFSNTLAAASLSASATLAIRGTFDNTLNSFTLLSAGSGGQAPLPPAQRDDGAGSGAARTRRKFRPPAIREDELSVLDRVFGLDETPSVPVNVPARPKPQGVLATAKPAESFKRPLAQPDYSDDDLAMILLLVL